MKVELSPYEKAVNILNGLTPRQDRIITEALNDLIRQRDTLRSEVARLTAEVEAMRAVVSTMEDFAEHDCTYGDGCPVFGSRHGVCIGCKARRALDALRARKVGG